MICWGRAVCIAAALCGMMLWLTSGTVNAQEAANYTGALAASSLLFARPEAGMPPDPGPSEAAYKFHQFAFTVPTAGTYLIRSAADFDNFTVLYAGSFQPNAPLTNALIANDDFGDVNHSGFDIALSPGVTYILVTTSYAQGATGTFTNRVYSTVPPAPTFARTGIGYPPVNLASSANATHYEISPWTPTTTGFYKIKTTSTVFDTFTALYDTTFDPAHPLSHAVIANSVFEAAASGANTSGFYVSATAGHLYQIVVAGETNSDYGSFHTDVTLIAPLQVTLNDDTRGAPPLSGGRPDTFSGDPPTRLTNFAPPCKPYAFRVSADGNYTLHVSHPAPVSPSFDTWCAIYRDSFDVTSPLTNLFHANDDFDTMTDLNRSALLDVPLTAGRTYVALVSGYNAISAGAFQMEIFGPGSVQLIRPVRISGQVATSAPNKTLPITFTVRPVGGTSADDTVRTVSVTTDAQGIGNYQLDDIPAGRVNLAARGQLMLQTVVSDIDATANVTGVNLTLRGGDGNQDGFTDITDLLLVIGAYNTVHTGEANGYNPLADFNFDDAVDITDLLIVIGSYNQASQYLP